MTEQNLRSVTLSLPETMIDAVDQAVEDAPDYLSLSRSEIIRYALAEGFDEDDDVLDLIPSEILNKYLYEVEHERLKAEFYCVDMREGWRGRTKSYLNARLAGEHPHHPRGIQIIADGYRKELEFLHRQVPESSRTLEEDREWLRERIEDYRDAWEAKQTVPDPTPFEGLGDGIETGRDLLQLRGEFSDVVEAIDSKAESNAYDPDAIVESVASEFAVSTDAVDVVLETLLPGDEDPRSVLKDLETSSIDSILPESAVEDLEAPEPEPDVEIQSDSRTDRIEGDMADDPIQVVPTDPDSVEDLPSSRNGDLDAEKIEALVQDGLRDDGEEVAHD
jgi:Arc/MetJ-type ribon-helix-helix transcriptional regulator